MAEIPGHPSLKIISALLALFLVIGTAGAGGPSGNLTDWWTEGEFIEGEFVLIPPSDADMLAGTIVVEDGPLTDGTGEFGCGVFYISGSPGPVNNGIGEPIDVINPRAYIPSGEDGTVTIIDTLSYQIVEVVEAGVSPYGMAIDDSGKRVYIGNRASNDISVIDLLTHEVVATIPAGMPDGMPAGLAIDHDNERLLITLEAAQALSVHDTGFQDEPLHVPLDHPPHDIVLSPSAPIAFVLSRSDATVSLIDLDDLDVIDSISLALDDLLPTAITVSPDGDRVYVMLAREDTPASRLAVIDTGTLEIMHDAFSANQWIVDLTLNDDGSSIYLIPGTDTCSVEAFEIDADTYEPVATHLLPGRMVRGIQVNGRFHVISTEFSALIAANNIDGNGNRFYQKATVGGDPAALGHFIGPALGPSAAPDTEVLDFGVVFGGSTVTQTLTFVNEGNLPYRIYQPSIPAQINTCLVDPCVPPEPAFSIIENDCEDGAEAFGGSCTITIEYAPGPNRSSSNLLVYYDNSQFFASSVQLTGSPLVIDIDDIGLDNAGDTTPPATPDTATAAIGSLAITELLLIWLILMAARALPDSGRLQTMSGR